MVYYCQECSVVQCSLFSVEHSCGPLPVFNVFFSIVSVEGIFVFSAAKAYAMYLFICSRAFLWHTAKII